MAGFAQPEGARVVGGHGANIGHKSCSVFLFGKDRKGKAVQVGVHQEQIDSDIEHWESEDNSSSDVDGGTSQKKADIDPSKMMARIMENELDLEDYDRGSSRRSFSKKNEQISEMLNILENDPQASILNERGSYEDTSMDYI